MKSMVAILPYGKAVGDAVTELCKEAGESLVFGLWQLESASASSNGERFSASIWYGYE